MGVTHLEVRGFKSIRELEIDFSPKSLNIFIGGNGAGKSNFIGVFRLLNQIAEGNLQAYVASRGGADSFLYYGSKKTRELFVRFDGNNNGYSATLIPGNEDELLFKNEIATFLKPAYTANPIPVELGHGHRETNLGKGSAVPKHTLDSMKTWRVYHFHDTSESASIKKVANVNDNRILRPDASNLAPFLMALRDFTPNNYSQIVDVIRQIAPFFKDFDLHPRKSNPDLMLLEWKEMGSDAYRNATFFSDGTLRFICLTTLLLQPELPQTILLDEPELGLHPAAIETLAEMLKLAAKKTQLMVSTQSVQLVNLVAAEDVIVVERSDDQSSFKRLDLAPLAVWMEDYSLGELWEKNLLGGRT